MKHVRWWATTALLWAAAASVTVPAAAQENRLDPRQRPVPDERRLLPMAPLPGQGFGRDEGADGRGGRLSPEERRQVRRDLQAARRDNYQRERGDPGFRRF